MATWVIGKDVTHASIKFLNKSGVELSYHIWLSPLPNNYEETKNYSPFKIWNLKKFNSNLWLVSSKY